MSFDAKTKITKAEKAKWVKALRSGKYAQTQGELKNDDGFCCLGVLREVCPRLAKTVNDVTLLSDVYQEEFYGVPEKAQLRLAQANDAGASFKKIAARIERYKSI